MVPRGKFRGVTGDYLRRLRCSDYNLEKSEILAKPTGGVFVSHSNLMAGIC